MNEPLTPTAIAFRKERRAYDKAMILALHRAGYGYKKIARACGFIFSTSGIARTVSPSRRESHRRQKAKWVALNKEKHSSSCAAYMAKRRKEDPSFRAYHKARTTARDRQTSDDFKRLTKSERSLVYRIHERKPKGYHVDHIWPIARRHEPGAPANIEHPSNLAYLTEEENLRKRAKLISELDWIPNYIYPDLD